MKEETERKTDGKREGRKKEDREDSIYWRETERGGRDRERGDQRERQVRERRIESEREGAR